MRPAVAPTTQSSNVPYTYMGTMNTASLEKEMEVFVYKTSISESDFDVVEPIISSVLAHDRWNFDFEDCDNILRVEFKASDSPTERLTHQLNQAGFECEELF